MSMTARELVVITTGIDIVITFRSSARCRRRNSPLSWMSRELDIVSYCGIERTSSPLRTSLAVGPYGRTTPLGDSLWTEWKSIR